MSLETPQTNKSLKREQIYLLFIIYYLFGAAVIEAAGRTQTRRSSLAEPESIHRFRCRGSILTITQRMGGLEEKRLVSARLLDNG